MGIPVLGSGFVFVRFEIRWAMWGFCECANGVVSGICCVVLGGGWFMHGRRMGIRVGLLVSGFGIGNRCMV